MMLQWSILALLAVAGVRGEGYPYSAPAPAPAPAPAQTYGPPAQSYAAPAQAYSAPAPDGAALTDGATYVQYPNQYYSEPGFSVQTGYEGYLVPASYPLQTGHSAGPLGLLGLLSALLPLPKLGLKLFPKVGLFLLGFLFLLLIGGAFTTAVCAFTPICTISFLGLGLTRNTMRSYLTPDRLTQTTAFVLDAIDKYKDITKKMAVKEKAERRRR